MPNTLPTVTLGWAAHWSDVRIKDCLRIRSIGSHEHLPAVWPDQKRTANALAASPRPFSKPTYVADPRDPDSKIPGDGSVIVEPQFAIWVTAVVMIPRHRPGAWRKDDPRPHESE